MKDRYFVLKNLIVAILLLSVMVSGCKKGDQTLGLNILPGVTLLETFFLKDTTPISDSLFRDTKIRVDHPRINLLGSFNDPVFGRTDASFAAQFRIPLFQPNYDASASLDSIVLYMTYKMIYGDTVTSQTIQVFELSDSLNYDTKYLSSYDVKSLASAEPIGSKSFVPKFRIGSSQKDTTIQIIRVPLNSAFGNRLLKMDPLKMTSNTKFLQAFKGLYIASTPVDRKGTLMSIINTPATDEETMPTIVLFYHDSKSDSLHSFAYDVTSNSANVSHFNHDYTLAKFFPNLDTGIQHDSLIYIQPTSGLKSKIWIPSLSAWKNKDSANYAINKATLTFHVDTIESDYRRYSMPSRLFLILPDKNAKGEEVFPADMAKSSSYYGGYYNHATASYSFNVTQHLQQLIADSIQNKGFYLIHSDRKNSAERVILKGNGSKYAKPELNVTYTRYK